MKRVFNFNHGIKNPQIMHPTRDWFAGLFMGLSFLELVLLGVLTFILNIKILLLKKPLKYSMIIYIMKVRLI